MLKRTASIVFLSGALVALSACMPASAPTRTAEAGLPTLESPSDLLFWTPAQREAGFRAMEVIVPHRIVRAGDAPHPLPSGEPLKFDPQPYMDAHKTAGLLVLQDGKIRMERYGLGFGPEGRWTSFSVAKSVTSTLVGAALLDGYIESLDSPIVNYLPELAGSAYDDVSVRQLLTMTSGADWNEDYEDPESDVARFFGEREILPGADPTLSYMRNLERAAKPGTRWHYSTGETSLVGVLVSRATGMTLADYLSQTIWRPYGMEKDAAWMVDESGQEPGGCCLVATLQDWGRVGQFVLDGGVIDGRQAVPGDWFDQATTTQAKTDKPERGYGFQWWVQDDGSFDAHGIFGQMIHIEPQQRLVVVIVSAWPVATSEEETAARSEFITSIRSAAAR